MTATNSNPYTRDILKGENLDIGEYTYGIPRVLWFVSTNRLKVGRFCSIAQEVTIFLGGEHRPDWVTTYPLTYFPDDWPEAKDIFYPGSKGDVVIGNDVWIGYGVTMLSGVRIGDGAVIGARAVVTKDVEPYSIVVGNPAKLVKKRFNKRTIRKLLEIRWWDWPPEKIKRNIHVICSAELGKMLQLT